MNEGVKKAIIQSLEVTIKLYGRRHLIVDKKQLRHNDLQALWDYFDDCYIDWLQKDLSPEKWGKWSREEILTDFYEGISRSWKTLRYMKYLIFTILDKDGAYRYFARRLIKSKSKHLNKFF